MALAPLTPPALNQPRTGPGDASCYRLGRVPARRPWDGETYYVAVCQSPMRLPSLSLK